MKKISNYRAFRMAGVSLGTISLMISALFGTDMSIIVPSAIGTGGFGLLINELAEYYKDKATLKDDNKMYFLWRLFN